MRHGKKNNHLGRTDTHRKAMLSNMASSLILHKRINTTVAKAKALRVYVEPLLTKSKTDSTHNRRVVFSYLQDKESVTILFREVGAKIAERQGGYTRIIKTGARQGDNAEMCFIELVDYNELYNAKAEVKKAKTTRRGRSSGKSGSSASTSIPLEVKQDKATVIEDQAEHSSKADADKHAHAEHSSKADADKHAHAEHPKADADKHAHAEHPKADADKHAHAEHPKADADKHAHADEHPKADSDKHAEATEPEASKSSSKKTDE